MGVLPRDNRYRWSLRIRLLIGVLLGLLPIAALLSVLWYGGRQRDREATLLNLVQTAEAVAVVSDTVFDAATMLGQAVASDPVVQTLDAAQVTPRIRQLADGAPQFSNIVVVSASGQVVGSASPLPSAAAAVNLSDRSYFQEVIGGRRPVTVLGIQNTSIGIVSGGVAVPVFAASETQATGAPIGLVAVNFESSRLSERLSQVRLFPGQIINLIDPTGRVAVQVGRSGAAAPLTWEQRDRSHLPEVQAALGGQIVTSHEYQSPVAAPGAAETRLAVFVPTPRYGWVISTTWPVSEALAASRAAELRELIIFLAIVLLTLGGALLLARALILPLRRLAEHTRTLGEGRFEPIPGAHDDDEIGAVTVAFNQMGERLQRTLDDLRQERGRLTAILQQLPVGVAIRAAPGGELILGNAEAERIWRVPFQPGTVLKPDVPATGFHLDGRPYALHDWPIFRALYAGESVTHEELQFRRQDGTGGVLSVRAAPIRDADGRIIAAVSSFDDVTAQRQQDALLREREELLRALLDQFPASVAVLDRDLRYALAAGRRLLKTGLTPEQMVGRSLTELYPDHLVHRATAHARRALAGETVSYDTEVQGIHLHVTMQPLHNAHGEIEHVLSVALDVTEERARLDIAVRDEKLHALGQMAGGIAHNLNQMLALVSGYGELARDQLDREPLDRDELARMIRIIERAAYDGGETVKRLLTFARGQDSERHHLVDISTLLHEVQQLTGPRWRDACRTEGRPITLTVEASPGISVVGSQAGLREALTNLVFNAVDAMPRGGTIHLSARRDGQYVQIDVADSGLGMTPEVRQKMFEPFFTTKGEHGTGLGLAMVFGIVRHHGGQIDVTSLPGQGTTMHLRLPAGQPEQATTQPDPAQPPPARLRALVVDDEVRLTMLAAGMLRRDGHEVIEAFSGEEALNRIHAEPLDLVITDLSMGEGMNGWELAAAARAAVPGLPVVLATGWGAAIDAEEARSRGVLAVLAKPYRLADLRAVVAQAIGARAPVAAEQGPASPGA